ncbi:carbohydrate-binding family 9-like protein [Cohnella sp. 56]|uniref:carbohydrate-binding family 9-like protein n=1 Tax=Cohnella sp. 56 TaxID=3113722 RepID=UPI0030EA44EF
MGNSYNVTYSTKELRGEAWAKVAPIRLAHYLWEHDEAPYRPETEVRVYFTDEAIHARFRVYEADPVAVHSEGLNPPVYRDSCVEFFLQPMPEQDTRYVNFEFNSAGAMLAGIGSDRHDRDPAPGLRPALYEARAERGLVDAQGQVCWQLECRIPFAALAEWFPGFAPGAPMTMKGNFYKCGDLTPHPHYAAWNDIPEDVPNFHLREYFGTLVFER